MFDGQMELSLGNAQPVNPRRRVGRRSRAQWWFQQMRRVVDHALDWQPTPTPRPEQMVLAGTHRQAPGPSVPRSRSQERQVCA